LIGDDRISANPKLNNVVKGGKRRARLGGYRRSNVLMPVDYIPLARALGPNTALSRPSSAPPESFAPRSSALSTPIKRWRYAGESCGYGFAQGKTMLWRRDILEAGGSIEALGAEIAEDAAATKLIRTQGFNAHLVDRPFQQPLGKRRLRDVWSRQLRWARLRRVTFPFFFAPEILTILASYPYRRCGRSPEPRDRPDRRRCAGGGVPLRRRGHPPSSPGGAVMAKSRGWLARDALCPSCKGRRRSGRNVRWRGNAMDVDEGVFLQTESEARGHRSD
jgi:ceramide glucosyltransferase